MFKQKYKYNYTTQFNEGQGVRIGGFVVLELIFLDSKDENFEKGEGKFFICFDQ